MTNFIHVSPQARVEALRRQIVRSRSARVMLVLPDDWALLDNPARLRLLQRAAQMTKKEFGLVSRSEETTTAAKRLGIPVFRREVDVPEAWRMSPALPPVDPRDPAATLPDPPPWRREDAVERVARPSYRNARQQRIASGERMRRPVPLFLRLAGYGALASLVLVVLGAFSLYVLPAATITLTPGRETIRTTFSVTANPDAEQPDFESNVLPARLIEGYIQESGSIPTSGSEELPTDFARGTVTFSTIDGSTAFVPSGTIVSTSSGTPVRFRTQQGVELNADRPSADVLIEAVEEGPGGNVRANAVNSVEGGLRFRVRVRNANATGGGGERIAAVVKQVDIETLSAQLQERAAERAFEVLQGTLNEEEWLPAESIQTFLQFQEPSRFVDEPATELSMNVNVLARGVAISEENAREVVLDALRREVPPRARLVADSVQLQRENEATSIGRTVVFSTTVVAEYVIPIDDDEIKARIAGLTPDEAERVLQQEWLLAGPPDIYRDPSSDWLGTLPIFANRIQVRVEYNEGDDANSALQAGAP